MAVTGPVPAAAVTMTAGWPTFESALLRRELVAERTMAFSFAKPAGWDFEPGQFIDITLLDPPETDGEGNTRGFSISSAPREDLITITTRLRDTAFKRVLQTMDVGTRVRIEGPFGDLRLHDADRPAVVLTGGIGITPFRSILVQAVRDGGLPYPVVVLYANRRPEDAAYLDELTGLAEADPNLTFVATMSELSETERTWAGERGRIDGSMLARHVDGAAGPIYYITGPGGMVRGLRSMLTEAGIAADDIRTETFTGY
ncbi:MAG TPA: FAD-dependent oxidoreductase [Candidatus Limnocylindrales bacterium]|nr:FAD-dependent oxidoreductase [Candidatus Limnocylindrales bacterium]